MAALQALIESACAGLGADVKAEPILAETRRNLYDGVPIDEVHKAAILAARTLLEKEPAYTRATARLLLHTIRKEVLGEEVAQAEMAQRYAEYFPQFIARGVAAELLDRRCCSSTWRGSARRSSPSATCSSTTSACRRCTTATSCTCTSSASSCRRRSSCAWRWAWRCNEIDREARAIEFYDVLSSFDFMSSTPTLFNSGTLRSQLSSCYLTTVADDLDGIYEALKENALLSKFAGGLGNDWTPVRALGSLHQGHQRQEPGRGAVPEGGQRHRGRGQPGRQAQGRGVRLPGELAPRHRRVPRAAQEHRRRPPAHARHEHRQLDPRPVHEAGDGRRRLDAVLAQHLPRPARQVRRRLRGRLHRLRSQGRRAARSSCHRTHAGTRPVAQDADDAVRDRASVDHVQGRLQRALARSSTWAWCIRRTCAPRSR